MSSQKPFELFEYCGFTRKQNRYVLRLFETRIAQSSNMIINPDGCDVKHFCQLSTASGGNLLAYRGKLQAIDQLPPRQREMAQGQKSTRASAARYTPVQY